MSHWPQFFFLGVYVVGFMGACVKAGSIDSSRPIVADLIGTGINVFVLYSGGFWAPFGWSP